MLSALASRRSLRNPFACLVLTLLLALMLNARLFAQSIVGTITRSGWKPSSLALYEAGNKLFVGDGNSGTIYIYDATTLADLGSVSTGLTEVLSMVVEETSGKLYATCFCLSSGRVDIVNAATNAYIGHIALDVPGTFAQVNKDDALHQVYVIAVGSFLRVDTTTDVVTPVAGISGNIYTFQWSVNPVTHEVFVPDQQAQTLHIVDGYTLTHTQIPNLMGFGAAVNWLENKVYVSYCAASGPTKIYDRDTGTVTSTSTSNDNCSIFFNPFGNRMYSASEVDKVSTIIEGTSDASFNLPMDTLDEEPAIRFATGHVYYFGSYYFGQPTVVLDDSSQFLVYIPHPPSADPGSLVSTGHAVHQTSGRLYAIDSNNVLVFQDTETLTRAPIYSGGTVLDSVSKVAVDSYLGFEIAGIAPRADKGRVYATGRWWTEPEGSSYLNIIAGTGKSNNKIGAIPTGGDAATIPVVTPDGTRAYVTNSGTTVAKANVGVIDLSTNSLLTTVEVGAVPLGAAITPDGSKVFVGNNGSDSVSVLSTTSNTVTGTIPVGTAPVGLVMNPAGTKVYVVNSGAGTVSVIDTNSQTVVKTINVGATPYWLAAAPDGNRVYVANYGSSSVSVIDTGDDSVVQTVSVATHPSGIGVLPDGSEVLVSTPSGLSVIKTSDSSVTSVSTPVGSMLAIADPTARFAGRVSCGGAPLGGVAVRALQEGVEKSSATTNAAGDYSIYNLRPGTYDLEVAPSGFGAQTANARVVGIGQTGPANFPLLATSAYAAVKPTSITFSPILRDVTSAPQVVTLTNGGATTLNVSGITVSGDFSLTSDCGNLPAELASAQSCHISLRFTPTVSGSRTGSLSIADNAPGSPHIVSLVGIGIQPVMVAEFSATELNFEMQTVGSPSPPQTVTLASSGTIALVLNSIQSSADFPQTNNCGASVAPGTSCSIHVRFQPTAGGNRSGAVTINHGASGSPYVIPVSGYAFGPGADLSPTSLNFPAQGLNTQSQGRVVTLHNPGNSSLVIDNIVTSGDFSQSNSCSTFLFADSTCSITVYFQPTAAGTRTGTLTITDNAVGSPHVVPLTGIGLAAAPAVSLSNSSVSFAGQLVGSYTAAQSVVVTNTGNAPLNISGISASQGFVHTHNCSGAIAPSATCTISVQFRPLACVAHAGTLTIVSNAPGTPHTVALSGTGQDLALSVSRPQRPVRTATQIVRAGSAARYEVSMKSSSGMRVLPRLSCEDLPAGATCSFQQGRFRPGQMAVPVRVVVLTEAPPQNEPAGESNDAPKKTKPGKYKLRVVASADGGDASLELELVVR